MHLFYETDLSPESIQLSPEEAKHCRSLRIKKGDIVYLTDGYGNLCKTEITADERYNFHVRILHRQKEYNRRTFNIHIAISPTKNPDRMEWFLEKVTEIGIDEITPILCEHTEKTHVNTERFRKIIISAMKQSFSAYLPKLNSKTTFRDFVEKAGENQKFIAYCGGKASLHLNSGYKKNQNVRILIGPEGDFTAEEVAFAEKNGFVLITLGKNRLRTETAGIMACSIINIMNT
ncbi:MAG: 16S rRNA (uracil(1498)-N(3))-methyltransferase [Bacteroidales bacterium]|jgi:16S rRNA (uracil1498-N3)-methyltransferase|nr:16S rRNA (uracil(1498)-N(3))-methyltransferase [Bacteroidales bacterium]MDD4214411.1 16S rRNA (uracil(1498)-N(3))-methyltransferase [Bacteroidales bacterium]